MLLLLVCVAAGAALVSGDCVHWSYGDVDRDRYGSGTTQTIVAALLAAVTATALGCLFHWVTRDHARLLVYAGVSVATCASIYVTGIFIWDILEGHEEWPILYCFAPLLALAVFAFVRARKRSGWRSAVFESVVCGVAAFLGALAIVFGFLVTYQPCIAFFGASCPEERPIYGILFALIVCGASTIPAIIAASWMGDQLVVQGPRGDG